MTATAPAGRPFGTLVLLVLSLRLAAILAACCVLGSVLLMVNDPDLTRDWLAAALITAPLSLLVLGLLNLGRQAAVGLDAVRGHRTLRGIDMPIPAELENTARTAGLAGRIGMVTDAAPFAVTYRLCHPRVLVSTGLLERCTPRQLAAVLAHEAEHVRRRDPLRMLLSRMLVARLPVLPIARHLDWLVRRDCELHADRHAIARCGRSSLAGALLTATDPPRPATPAGAVGFGTHTLLESRINQLEGSSLPTGTPRVRTIAGTVAGAALLVWAIAGSALLITAFPPPCIT